MARTYICLHLDYEDNLAPLTDAEVGRLIRALLRYGRTGEVPKLNKVLMQTFIPIKKQIDIEAKHYDKVCKANAENIRKRWSVNAKLKPEGVKRFPGKE